MDASTKTMRVELGSRQRRIDLSLDRQDLEEYEREIDGWIEARRDLARTLIELVDRHGAVRIEDELTQYPPHECLYLHPSTRPGHVMQLTAFDDAGPSWHEDIDDESALVREVRSDWVEVGWDEGRDDGMGFDLEAEMGQAVAAVAADNLQADTPSASMEKTGRTTDE